MVARRVNHCPNRDHHTAGRDTVGTPRRGCGAPTTDRGCTKVSAHNQHAARAAGRGAARVTRGSPAAGDKFPVAASNGPPAACVEIKFRHMGPNSLLDFHTAGGLPNVECRPSVQSITCLLGA